MLAKLRHQRDDGFTLIELLVVMIIIGILAAVAIPIFLNQQKTARDSQTTSDMKNLINNMQASLVRHPDPGCVALLPTASTAVTCSSGGGIGQISKVENVTSGKVYLYVGKNATSGEITEVSVSKGTSVGIWGGAIGYATVAWNENGKSYTSHQSSLRYDSSSGQQSHWKWSAPTPTPTP